MRLHHLAFRVADVDHSVDFFRHVFDLAVVRDDRPRSAWLGLADGSVLMIERRNPAEPTLPSGALDLVAWRCAAEEKDRIRRLAIAAGCFDGETEHTVYLRDPDGRRVAVSTYPLL